MAHRYYHQGYQGPSYSYNWKGYGAPASQAAGLRSLGDVTRSDAFMVPAADDPYYLHKKDFEKAPVFRVPKSQSPYYLHKADQLAGFGPPAGTPPGPLSGIAGLSTATLATIAGVGAAVYFLVLRK